MLSTNILWIIAFLIMFLNLIIYVSDPLKHSNQVECLGLHCRNYSFAMALFAFTIDLIIMIVLTHTKPFIEFMPSMWYVALGILGYLLIFLTFKTNFVVEQGKKLDPPDDYLLNKNIRLIMYIIVLALYIILFVTLYTVDTQNTIAVQPFLERFLYNRFGGYKKGNKIMFALSLLIILGIPLASIRVHKGIYYHPQFYKLPLSWKI